MEYPDRVPEVSPESVRTLSGGVLVGSPCPVCGRVELRGRQTVCSAACRRERSRQKQAAELEALVTSIGQALELLRTHRVALAERVEHMRRRRARRAGPGP